MILGTIALLWYLGLVPKNVYVETIGNVGNLLSRIPFLYTLTFSVTLLSALVTGLIVRHK